MVLADCMSCQCAGGAAIVTARMTERADIDGRAREYVSWMSQAWILERGKWRLVDMQLVADEQSKDHALVCAEQSSRLPSVAFAARANRLALISSCL